MKDEIKEILLKFNKEVEKAELTRNPYSNEDKKFKHILVSLSEEHFNIFKDALNYITNLQQIEQDHQRINGELREENQRLKETIENLTTMTVCGDRKQIKNTTQYKLEIYKSRIDKAIEFIKTTPSIDGYINHNAMMYMLLNILQGDDTNVKD